MSKLFDENGAEVEAFTAEELKSKQEEAIAEHLKNNPDKSDEIEKLKADLADATEKLKESGMSEGQKERLKKAKEDAEGKLADTVGTLTKEIADLKETFTSTTKNKVLTALSKGDTTVKEKLELKYAALMKTGEYKPDEAGITAALTDAATLVMGSKPQPGFLDNMSGAGERGAPQARGNATPETENSKAMRAALGIKDADAAKYEGKVA